MMMNMYTQAEHEGLLIVKLLLRREPTQIINLGLIKVSLKIRLCNWKHMFPSFNHLPFPL